MIKPLATFVICGIAYLFVLEFVGNFITRDLQMFKERVKDDFEISQMNPKQAFADASAYRTFLRRQDL